VTNSTGYVDWSINEALSSSSCTLTYPNGSTSAVEPCMSPWSKLGLAEGVHSFKVSATDLEGNLATVSKVWRVGK